MKTSSIGTFGSFQQQTVRFTLSLPMQATLYTSLCALTLWTIYFSAYPATHLSVISYQLIPESEAPI
ncbi:MAG: hypothetical protein LDL41_04030 [Coleofasciculus sp. S288]|nr:hypothetical protein [Coleofasciculus sp. S288]